QMKAHGIKPNVISVDNYFKNREDTPKDADGKYDFECLEAINVEAFNKDMLDLLAGKAVDIPVFNFVEGKSEYRANFITMGPSDVLIIEGIHGLNNGLSYSIPEANKFKIYISALTQLNVDFHNRVPTTDTRLLRRIVRDNQYRGASATKTISMWPSVRHGEDHYIFPFQEEADVMFNSALIYELAVLKQYAEPLLLNVPADSKVYIEAKRLVKFLDYFMTIPSEQIPTNSLIREFIGGSCFRT
nr:nucleoside kinase [Vallitaleaceae bacterium]